MRLQTQRSDEKQERNSQWVLSDILKLLESLIESLEDARCDKFVIESISPCEDVDFGHFYHEHSRMDVHSDKSELKSSLRLPTSSQPRLAVDKHGTWNTNCKFDRVTRLSGSLTLIKLSRLPFFRTINPRFRINFSVHQLSAFFSSTL